MLGQGDEDISTTSLAENARDEGGYSSFMFLDTPRGKGGGRDPEVADAARFAEAVTTWKRGEREAIDHYAGCLVTLSESALSLENTHRSECTEQHGTAARTRSSQAHERQVVQRHGLEVLRYCSHFVGGRRQAAHNQSISAGNCCDHKLTGQRSLERDD